MRLDSGSKRPDGRNVIWLFSRSLRVISVPSISFIFSFERENIKLGIDGITLRFPYSSFSVGTVNIPNGKVLRRFTDRYLSRTADLHACH